MDSDLEGIGAAITGGLAARAVEPGHGEAGAPEHSGECGNCSMPLDGPYCRYCGQKAHVHRSISAIAHDLIHGVLHLDGKFWRTLPLLAWRPGELTRRYAQGERAKFVSPLGMFLFATFMMFAMFSAFGLSLANINLENAERVVDPDAAIASLDRQVERMRNERATLVQRLESTPGQDDQSLQDEIEALDGRIAGAEDGREAIARLGGDGEFSGENFQIVGGDFRTGWDRLDSGIDKLEENPSLALYKLQANGFKFSWLLIPISVPFVWLLFFWTRRFRMYDHTVFVTYSLAFMSLLVITLTLLGFAGMALAPIVLAAIFIPPIHIFRQLKGAYRLHWASALIRTFILVNFCWITASFFFLLLLGIGAVG